MTDDAIIERVARAVREEIIRQYREDERGKCPAGVSFYEEEIMPLKIASAAIAAHTAALAEAGFAIVKSMLIRLTPTPTSASMHSLSGSEVTMTEAHKTIATFLNAQNAKEMTVWEMGRADRLLTMGVSPEDVALRIMRARHGETAP